MYKYSGCVTQPDRRSSAVERSLGSTPDLLEAGGKDKCVCVIRLNRYFIHSPSIPKVIDISEVISDFQR